MYILQDHGVRDIQYLICAPIPNTHNRQGSPQSQPGVVRVIDWSEHVIPVRS